MSRNNKTCDMTLLKKKPYFEKRLKTHGNHVHRLHVNKKFITQCLFRIQSNDPSILFIIEVIDYLCVHIFKYLFIIFIRGFKKKIIKQVSTFITLHSSILIFSYCHICLLSNCVHSRQSKIHFVSHISFSHTLDCKHCHMCHRTTLESILVYIHHFHYHTHFHYNNSNIFCYKCLPSNQSCN